MHEGGKKGGGGRDERQREGAGGGGEGGGVEEEEENSLVSIRGKRRPSRCRPMKTDGDSLLRSERERGFEGSRCPAGRSGEEERSYGNMPSSSSFLPSGYALKLTTYQSLTFSYNF